MTGEGYSHFSGYPRFVPNINNPWAPTVVGKDVVLHESFPRGFGRFAAGIGSLKVVAVALSLHGRKHTGITGKCESYWILNEELPAIVYPRDFTIEDDPGLLILVWRSAPIVLWRDKLGKIQFGLNDGGCFCVDPAKVFLHCVTVSKIFKEIRGGR